MRPVGVGVLVVLLLAQRLYDRAWVDRTGRGLVSPRGIGRQISIKGGGWKRII